MMAAEEATEAAARVAGLTKTATVVTAKAATAKRLGDALSSSVLDLGRGEQGQEDGTAALARELQARLARLEGEVTSLRSQLRDAAPTALAAAEAVPMPGAGVQGGEQQ